ncbi:hypothetical protein [Rhizobium mayense]|uniref:Peptidase S8 n=1 Tax=Rhizobium mayense TaxID=1312184 RepID=A0ABT7K3C6_9HYPH|nr:hypothetical protein [Rhizobium mayense]MDL2403110.1 hypothetical protein [Rhizobium mayense]
MARSTGPRARSSPETIDYSKDDKRRHTPTNRRLRGYSFDPSLSAKLETAFINERIYTVPWEPLAKGPVGEYVEVIDVDPASKFYYDPVDLEDPHLLAQDGLPASPLNPKFHQQMVYAVVMTTVKNFERAIARPVMWSDRAPWKKYREMTPQDWQNTWVRRLAVYPHALREANAYYSPAKKALLFGYFPASAAGDPAVYPGGIVFGCLSHDIVAHETAHAILDGIHPRFMEVTQPDGLAFHEAFADIVAMFQHFTFIEVVKHQISKTRGDMGMNSLLGELAQEFGRATGNRGSLRNALGSINKKTGKWERRPPDPRRMETEVEPHDRGSILVSAVFDSFVSIYESRIADLRRIASGGTGILNEGELHPDLVNRLSAEAVKAAKHVLNMCIRALDYCPPVDIDFGDYLRALITADCDVFPDDIRGYRIAFIDAFRQHGIYPRKLRSLSEEALTWDRADEINTYTRLAELSKTLQQFYHDLGIDQDRHARWQKTRQQRAKLHDYLQEKFWLEYNDPVLQKITGLDFNITRRFSGDDMVRFEVHAMWPVQRQRQDGSVLNQVIFSILQHKPLEEPAAGLAVTTGESPGKQIWGGCTIIVDLGHATSEQAIRYVIRKPLYSNGKKDNRITRAQQWAKDPAVMSLAATYGMIDDAEPFAMLHSGE